MTRTKKVFLYTVIIGILTHAFRMTNVMICTDTANYLNTISPSWVTSLGRFLLPLIEKIRGTRELPWLIGVICILLIGIAAILIAELFDIKGTISLVLL
ncbi:MAG TPA: glucosyltransferase domain-containing protein, partial [Lachnospiraceae bacterium]|nr:glucosyltransferase domain-containing protein [Lachnospiraceae bacterium]